MSANIIAIIAAVILVIVLVSLITGEGYAPMPTTPCIPAMMTPSPTTPPDPSTSPSVINNVDDATLQSYKTAYTNYNAAFNAYNKTQTCVPNVCVNGILDNGNCICANGTPYVHTDNKIYCVPIDLSANLTTDANLIFDTAKSKFVCKAGYDQTQLANGDTKCYNTSNIDTVKGYINSLNAATSAINTAPRVTSAYGMAGGFYIAGQALLPSGVTAIASATNVQRTSTNDCATNATNPTNATLFAYNPTTQKCTYYTTSVDSSGGVPLSTIQAWTSSSTSAGYTIGSKKL
jgi:hypothetical protein